MLCSRCHEPWRRPQIEWPEHRAFRIQYFVRQFPHHAPLSADLARRRFCRSGVRKLAAIEGNLDRRLRRGSMPVNDVEVLSQASPDILNALPPKLGVLYPARFGLDCKHGIPGVRSV